MIDMLFDNKAVSINPSSLIQVSRMKLFSVFLLLITSVVILLRSHSQTQDKNRILDRKLLHGIELLKKGKNYQEAIEDLKDVVNARPNDREARCMCWNNACLDYNFCFGLQLPE